MSVFTWDNFDPADSRIARRSLLAFATGTLLLENMTILSDDFSFFGLVVEVSQPQLVALGQVTTAIFLTIYLAKEVPNILVAWRDWSDQRLKAKQSEERYDLADSWGFDRGGPYEEGPEGEFKELDDTHDWEKQRLIKKFGRLVAAASIFSSLLTTYLLPVGLALLATFYPSSLNDLTSAIVRW